MFGESSSSTCEATTILPPVPDEIVRYPITGEENGGRLFMFGKPDAENVVLLCGGYPDDQQVFVEMAARLAKEGNCFCGVACLVGFDSAADDRPWTSYRSQGYNFSEMTWSLRNEALEEKDTLLSPDKIIYIDVMPMKLHPSCTQLKPAKRTTKEFITVHTYRYVFMAAHLIQRFLSQYLAAFFFLFVLTILSILGLVPSHPKDTARFTEKKVPLDRLIYMAFPYYHLAVQGAGKAYLPRLEETPVLYLYGADKSVQFHDDNLVNHLQEQKGCEVVAVNDTGHYLFLQKPDLCLSAIKRFILDTRTTIKS
jgi:pimeloyl-ACP methyl ester carboxylesterase